jgi:hypothetical protein
LRINGADPGDRFYRFEPLSQFPGSAVPVADSLMLAAQRRSARLESAMAAATSPKER